MNVTRLVKHALKRQHFQQAAVFCFINDAGVGQFAFRPHIATTALESYDPNGRNLQFHFPSESKSSLQRSQAWCPFLESSENFSGPRSHS